MKTGEELIDVCIEIKHCSVGDGYGDAFDEMIRTEFLNGVWHKASENIPNESCCIVITKDDDIKIMCFNKRSNSFLRTNDEEPYGNIDKWCYITDMLSSDDKIKFKLLDGNRK